MQTFTFSPIGYIRSPYKEKFAIPRQPGLIEDGSGSLILNSPFNSPDIVRDLNQFSHIWLTFVFHQTQHAKWHPTVRPPRLGGNTRTGVFATRSPFRPNPIGLSLVELKNISIRTDHIELELSSIDLVDGTPILDIKPYLPFAESKPNAKAGFAQGAPTACLDVIFTAEVEHMLNREARNHPTLYRFIQQVLAQDPRPAYHKINNTQREYAIHLFDFNIRWRVTNTTVEVFAVERA